MCFFQEFFSVFHVGDQFDPCCLRVGSQVALARFDRSRNDGNRSGVFRLYMAAPAAAKAVEDAPRASLVLFGIDGGGWGKGERPSQQTMELSHHHRH